MKYSYRGTFSILFIFLFLNLSRLEAQIYRRQPQKEQTSEMKSFADHLWYGGGFTINFSSGLAGLDGNTFGIGLSPMLGYKLNSFLSVGPRFEFLYTTGRFRNFGGPVYKYNGLDYGAGVFGRAKFLNVLFAHTELSYINRVFPVGFNGNRLETERVGDNQFLVGLGYSGGGLLKSEIYLLYDVSSDSQSTTLPLVYRFGITYNF